MIADIISSGIRPPGGGKAPSSRPPLKRPRAKLLCRIRPKNHPRYKWRCYIGLLTDTPEIREFFSREEAESYAAKINTPENLMAAFRPLFGSDEETVAYLGLKLQQPAQAEPDESDEQLTPQQPRKTGRYMRSTPFRVKPFHNKSRPNLRFVVNGIAAGKRARKYFETQEAAKAYASKRNIEVQNQGFESLEMPAWLRSMALHCNERLSGIGKTLADATDHFLRAFAEMSKSVSLTQLRAEFIADRKTTVTRRHWRRLEKNCQQFNEFVGADRLACEVTPKHVDDWIASLVGLAPASKNCALIAIGSYFGFAEHPKRGYIGKNPTAACDLLKVIESPVGILTPSETERLLVAASGMDEPILPYFAIGAFAGLRRAELLRLDWSEVDLQDGFIEVTAAKSKTAARRVVKILPCLAAWLSPYAKPSGLVVPFSYQSTANNLVWEGRKRADALIPENERDANFHSLHDNWPRNALRHSFASYHLAHFKDAAALALEMGHTTTNMIFKHYRQVVRTNVAALYWQIMPKGATNVVKMPVARSTSVAARCHFEATGRS